MNIWKNLLLLGAFFLVSGVCAGEKVRMFGFVSIGPADSISKDQVGFLARSYSILTLNKQAGAGESASVMQEVQSLAGKLISVTSDLHIPCYLNSVIPVPGSPQTSGFLDHPEWVLKDTAGNPVLIRNLKNCDMRIPQVGRYWAESCHEMVSHPHIDGVFVDAIPKPGMKNHAATKQSLVPSRPATLKPGVYGRKSWQMIQN